MSIYICEEYAQEKGNEDWKHQDNCLLCEVLKEMENIMDNYEVEEEEYWDENWWEEDEQEQEENTDYDEFY